MNVGKMGSQEKGSSSNLANVQQKVKKLSDDFVGETQSVKSPSASTGSVNKDKVN